MIIDNWTFSNWYVCKKTCDKFAKICRRTYPCISQLVATLSTLLNSNFTIHSGIQNNICHIIRHTYQKEIKQKHFHVAIYSRSIKMFLWPPHQILAKCPLNKTRNRGKADSQQKCVNQVKTVLLWSLKNNKALKLIFEGAHLSHILCLKGAYFSQIQNIVHRAHLMISPKKCV